MITVSKAIKLIDKYITVNQGSKVVGLMDANSYSLSKTVLSPIHMPPFRQSAMDGYALCLHDAATYTIVGEVRAGDHHQPHLKPGEAVRIYTGACVPDAAHAVVMQEKVLAKNGQIVIETPIAPNLNIRPLGEQVKRGRAALKKGTRLTPAAIGYLASLGLTNVEVFKKPSVAIVVTGNELADRGQPLAYGKIYESNGAMLYSALNSLGYPDVSTYRVDDNYQNTISLLKDVMGKYDTVLITGGISVGTYDFVGRALQELAVEEIFYKVKQKPGKPLFFGKKGHTPIFALPGNPAAALNCFYVYVCPALQKMSGATDFSLTRTTAKSVSNFRKRGGTPQFLKAILKDGGLTILEGQSSSMLQTFALANALAYVPEDKIQIDIGDEVDVICLP